MPHVFVRKQRITNNKAGEVELTLDKLEFPYGCISEFNEKWLEIARRAANANSVFRASLFPFIFCQNLMLSYFFHIPHLLQVECHRFDPGAYFFKWKSGFITLSYSRLAHASTKELAIVRATGRESTPPAISPKVESCRALVDNLEGRGHVMAVSFSASSATPELFYAFETTESRNVFMKKLNDVGSVQLVQDAPAFKMVGPMEF